jgi:hypothetical protein
MLLRYIAGFLFAALMAGSAAAQRLDLTAGVTAGTLGVGPEVGVRINDTIGVRANAALIRSDFVEVDADGSDIDIDYKGPVRARSGGAMLDVYPFGGGFRLSAGVRRSGFKATMTATPTTNVTIGSRTVTPVQVGKLSADYRVRDWAPAATIGFAGAIASRLIAGIEAGLLFHGAPQIRRLRSEGGTLSGDPGFAADLERERMFIENDIDDYKFYPVVQASLAFRF